MLRLKCNHLFLCEFHKLFSTVKHKFRHKFSQFIHKFNIWILKCWSWLVYTSKFFPIDKRDGKLGFFKSLDCTSKFCQFTKVFENWGFWSPFAFILLSNGEDSLQYDMWRKRGANLWLNYQFSRKIVYIIT